MFALGILDARFEDVGRLVVGWTAYLVGEFRCVFIFGSSISCLPASATMFTSLAFVPCVAPSLYSL